MNFDAIIIGGGIIGITCGFYLTRAGKKVLVMEQGRIGGGTTGNSFAWANATSKTTDQTYHELNAAGLLGYQALQAEFGPDAIGVISRGALQIAKKTDAAGLQSLQSQARALDSFGYPCRWIDHAELAALEPHMDLTDDSQALFAPDDICLYAPHFTRFMAGRIVTAGGTVWQDCTALELLANDNGQVTGVRCEKGEMHAPNAILATGPDTPETLSALTGYEGYSSRFPMRKVPGLLLTTPPVTDGLLRHMTYAPDDNEVHLLPDVGGGIKIGSDDVDGLIADDQSAENLRNAGQMLLDRAQKLIPDLAADIDHCTLRLGIRAYPEDGRTIAGPIPGAKGFYLVATHSGITLAPVIGQLMAELIDTGQTPDRLTPFSLGRFSGFS